MHFQFFSQEKVKLERHLAKLVAALCRPNVLTPDASVVLGDLLVPLTLDLMKGGRLGGFHKDLGDQLLPLVARLLEVKAQKKGLAFIVLSLVVISKQKLQNYNLIEG